REVVVQRFAARLRQAAMRRPEPVEREDEVAAAAPAAEVVTGVALAEPDLDAAAEIDLDGLAAAALHANRAHLTLGRGATCLVERRQHLHQHPGMTGFCLSRHRAEAASCPGSALPGKGGSW